MKKIEAIVRPHAVEDLLSEITRGSVERGPALGCGGVVGESLGE